MEGNGKLYRMLLNFQATPFGQIRYSIIGDDSAVDLFRIDEFNGRITISGDLSAAGLEQFRVCLFIVY